MTIRESRTHKRLPKLDARLLGVAELVRATTHIDIGSDHGRLLLYLHATGRIKNGIAIENKQSPYENSKNRLRHTDTLVRLGDGFSVAEPDEAQSASLCGMGATAIVRILDAFPDRVPDQVIVQPNRQPELVRRWALRRGFHLDGEVLTPGHWAYTVMRFVKRPGRDPAYEGVDAVAAELFGPLLIRRSDPMLVDELRQQVAYLKAQRTLHDDQRGRLKQYEQVLIGMGHLSG